MRDIEHETGNQCLYQINGEIWRQISKQVDDHIRVEILNNIRVPIWNQTNSRNKPQIHNQVVDQFYEQH